MNIFKITKFLQKGDKTLFDIPCDNQKALLDKLGNAKNDVDRSYKQFTSQMFFVSNKKKITFNLFAAIAFPFVLSTYLVKRYFTKRGDEVEALMQDKGMDEVVPTLLFDRFSVSTAFWHEGLSLSIKDIVFIWELIKRAPFRPYFVLKTTSNIAKYSHIIYRHHPSVIIAFREYSFSSSALTAYCNQHGIKHINVMHGEKLYYIRDSFFRFDECYVWSQHYKDLFISMLAEPTQFRIELPPSMQIECSLYLNQQAYADYKYYLADYDELEIKNIVSSLQFVKEKGKTVKYRVHPRYSNVSLLLKYVSENEVEYPKYVTIQESISNLEYAIGSYTTVLTQAFYAGKKVILDDVTYKEQYVRLQSLDYVLSSENSLRLSDCQS